MKKTLSIFAAAGLLASSTAQAQDSAIFKPSSAWAADYGDDYCRLVRSFSDGSDTIDLALQRIQPGAETQLLLIGDAIKTFRGAAELGWHFLPGDGARKTPYSRSVTGDGQQYLRMDGVFLVPAAPPTPGTPPGPPPYDRTAEQTVGKALTGLIIEGGLTKPVQIETGRLEAPVKALQACTDDLIKTWGLDAEKHKTLSAAAAPQLGAEGWLPQGTIPFGEFAKFAGGGNQVRLMIDAGGKPTACLIHSPTLEKSLNDRICQILMEKASFTPAKDAAGQAMASYWLGSPMFLGPPMRGRR